MEEKILARSKHRSAGAISLGIVLVSFLVFVFLWWQETGRPLRMEYELGKPIHCHCLSGMAEFQEVTWEDFLERHPTLWSYLYEHTYLFGADDMWYTLLFIVGIIIAIVFNKRMKKHELIISDRRVYGKTYSGRQVSVPLSSIVFVKASGMNGISVGTSSGKVEFKLLKNQREMLTVLKQLLDERHNEDSANSETVSTVDELKKYKELLDSGVITEEDFQIKKSQLLNL